MMLTGVILAAGHSSRMGIPKALLHYRDDRSFSQNLSDVFRLADVDDVVGTFSSDAAGMRVKEHFENAGIEPIQNRYMDAGLLGSLCSVTESRPEASGFIFTPVDNPFMQTAAVAALTAALRSPDVQAAQLTYRGSPGHPAALSQRRARALPKTMAAKLTAKSLFRDSVQVEWENDAVVTNINTPDEFFRIFRRRPEAVGGLHSRQRSGGVQI